MYNPGNSNASEPYSLRLPEGFDQNKDYPAVVVTGPMLSIKEQAQSVYAERLTEAGYVTLVFDGSYFGESEGMLKGSVTGSVFSDARSSPGMTVELLSPT